MVRRCAAVCLSLGLRQSCGALDFGGACAKGEGRAVTKAPEDGRSPRPVGCMRPRCAASSRNSANSSTRSGRAKRVAKAAQTWSLFCRPSSCSIRKCSSSPSWKVSPVRRFLARYGPLIPTLQATNSAWRDGSRGTEGAGPIAGARTLLSAARTSFIGTSFTRFARRTGRANGWSRPRDPTLSAQTGGPSVGPGAAGH